MEKFLKKVLEENYPALFVRISQNEIQRKCIGFLAGYKATFKGNAQDLWGKYKANYKENTKDL